MLMRTTSVNEGSFPSTWNQLMTCIDWLADNNSLLLVFSKLAGPTARTCTHAHTSGGNSSDTISTIRSLITDAFDFTKSFVFQNILVKGANGIKGLMSSYYFCIRCASANV